MPRRGCFSLTPRWRRTRSDRKPSWGEDAAVTAWSETKPLYYHRMYYHRIMGMSTKKASDMVYDQAVTVASSPHEGQCQLTLSLSIVGLTRNMVSDHIQPCTAIYRHTPHIQPCTAIYRHTPTYSHVPPYTAIHLTYSHISPYIAVLSIVDIYKKLESVFSRGLT